MNAFQLLLFCCTLLQYVLNPTFQAELISKLDTNPKMSRAYDGTTYLPGLRNIFYSYITVILCCFVWRSLKKTGLYNF